MRQLATVYAASGETIAERYKRIGGFTSGFDYLRIVLAVGVVLHHSVAMTDHEAWRMLWLGWPRVIYGQILPAFFALSGFLVAASLEKRPTVAYFMSMRALRLVPALAVEVLLSAIILGACLTELPLGSYFSSPIFWSYFLNIVGDIHLNLPGVFKHNLVDYVNGSLWTLPYELECYGALMVLYLAGFIQHKTRLIVALAAVMLLGYAWTFLRYQPSWTEGPLPGRYLVMAFLIGVGIQRFADKIRLNVWAFLVCLAAGTFLSLWVETSLIAVVPIAYATVYLGMLNPKKLPIILSGDYSYGLYLFAFPIQQAQVALFPAYRWWGYNAVFALVLGFAYAAFSWWCVEKPILQRKRVIASTVEHFWLQLISVGAERTSYVRNGRSATSRSLDPAVGAQLSLAPDDRAASPSPGNRTATG